MGYEFDIVGIGKQSKSGDAIVIRWGNLYGSRHEQRIVLIDGGFHDTAQDVINHIKTYYRTTLLDAVVSTHPDQDHINGLVNVIDEFSVKQLWIHNTQG